MKRTPLKRGKGLRPLSHKRRQKVAQEKEIREAYLAAHPYCEAARAGAPQPCFGALHIHEVVPRGRGGDTGDKAIFKSVCDHHNRNISQDSETMQWAYDNGFLYHSYDDFYGRMKP